MLTGHPPDRKRPSSELAFRVFVMGDSGFGTEPLPERGRLLVGSAPSCDLLVEGAAAEHALLVVDDGFFVEDLGTGAPTRVRGQPVAPRSRTPLSPGDPVQLGDTLLMIEPRPTAPPRRILPPEYLELRLEEECQRAERTRSGFTLLRVVAPDAPAGTARLEDVLSTSLRLQDLVSAATPHEFVVLLLDTPARESELVAERLRGALVATAIDAEVRTATYPKDGRSADALMESLSGQPRNDPDPSLGDAPLGLDALLDRIAPADINVLIRGETGVGKERTAHAVHERSHRAGKPFLVLNCGALPEALLEGELFGYERGAFTGAHQAKPGLLETAEGGTVFLDEIGELPLSMQAKLLRVLEERRVMRLGGLKPKIIDVRFVAATNRDLELEVQQGTFRQDLYFRLNGITLQLQPLRERADEILPLARTFAEAAALRFGRKVPRLSADVAAALRAYPWPGNIRELRNVMERAVLLCDGEAIEVNHLPAGRLSALFAQRRPQRPQPAPGAAPLYPDITPPPVRASHARAAPAFPDVTPTPIGQASAVRSGASPEQLRDELAAIERERIVEALARCAGNQTQAAFELGMSRRTLVKRLSAYGLPRPRKRLP